jgi:Holliday junction resolvasome RuvABC endonuclease subunit
VAAVAVIGGQLPALVRNEGAPQVVVVETPTGVVLFTLASWLDCPIVDVPISTWKAEIVGAGNASKTDVREFARSQGWRFSTQDEADALCIGRYAQTLEFE